MRFDIIDIDENEWIALDYLMEDVEKGIQKEDVLLNNETFLHLLCAVKFDKIIKERHHTRYFSDE